MTGVKIKTLCLRYLWKSKERAPGIEGMGPLGLMFFEDGFELLPRSDVRLFHSAQGRLNVTVGARIKLSLAASGNLHTDVAALHCNLCW